jgi:hypothetical protein
VWPRYMYRLLPWPSLADVLSTCLPGSLFVEVANTASRDHLVEYLRLCMTYSQKLTGRIPGYYARTTQAAKPAEAAPAPPVPPLSLRTSSAPGESTVTPSSPSRAGAPGQKGVRFEKAKSPLVKQRSQSEPVITPTVFDNPALAVLESDPTRRKTINDRPSVAVPAPIATEPPRTGKGELTSLSKF